MPAGDAVVGRLINVVGDPIDHGPAVRPLRWRARPIHLPSPCACSRSAPACELFLTGIKAIDLLAPLALGGKAAMFGGAGVGKTVRISRY